MHKASYLAPIDDDTLNRLTCGPLGGYTHGDSAHVHAAIRIGTS